MIVVANPQMGRVSHHDHGNQAGQDARPARRIALLSRNSRQLPVRGAVAGITGVRAVFNPLAHWYADHAVPVHAPRCRGKRHETGRPGDRQNQES